MAKEEDLNQLQAQAILLQKTVHRLQYENELKDLRDDPVEEDVSSLYDELDAAKMSAQSKDRELSRLKLDLENIRLAVADDVVEPVEALQKQVAVTAIQETAANDAMQQRAERAEDAATEAQQRASALKASSFEREGEALQLMKARDAAVAQQVAQQGSRDEEVSELRDELYDVAQALEDEKEKVAELRRELDGLRGG